MLLGLKKRGFGVGKWSAHGGKASDDAESIHAAAVRELQEEAGIVAKALDRRGIVLYQFLGEPAVHEVHYFRATSWSGNVTESEEMRCVGAA